MISIPGVPTSIPQRQVALQITLAKNTQTQQPVTFQETGTNSLSTLNIQGLRVSARIRSAGTFEAQATVRVWGLTPSLMNQLSALGLIFNSIPRNQITITAGDPQSGMSIVFQGTIMFAYGDYENQPEAPFYMEALAGGASTVTGMGPSSYPNSFQVSQALQTIGQKMNLSFAGQNINVTLPPMYISGPPLVQARKLARAANLDIGQVDGVMEITQKAGPRPGPPVLVSPQNGMIAYPSYTTSGLLVKTIFNPAIKFKSQIQVQSSVLSAISALNRTGPYGAFPSTWIVYKLDLDLDALVPKGQWMTTCYGFSQQAVQTGQTPINPNS